MTAKLLLNKLKRKNIVILPEETLDDILEIKGLKIIREDDTHISDHIRILKINSVIILQERTTKHELSLRKLKSIEEADKVVNDRLETYEKMWDGCGCNDLPPLVVPVIMLYSPIKHWLLEGEVSPPVPEVQILMNYVV